MASDATKKATRGNIHMDSRVFDIADLKSEVIFSLPLSYAGLHGHCPLVCSFLGGATPPDVRRKQPSDNL